MARSDWSLYPGRRSTNKESKTARRRSKPRFRLIDGRLGNYAVRVRRRIGNEKRPYWKPTRLPSSFHFPALQLKALSSLTEDAIAAGASPPEAVWETQRAARSDTSRLPSKNHPRDRRRGRVRWWREGIS